MKKVLIAKQILIIRNIGNDRGWFYIIDTLTKGTELWENFASCARPNFGSRNAASATKV